MPEECKSEHICFCPLEGVINVISKKWALLMINAIGNCERIRFNDLTKELGGISPKTLSDTLKELHKEGLIKRESFAEIPPRVEYSLTKDGVELRKSIIPLLKWAATREKGKTKCAGEYRKITAHRMKNLTPPE
jgi:DNA-binding HxlR family transcriptional regulator